MRKNRWNDAKCMKETKRKKKSFFSFAFSSDRIGDRTLYRMAWSRKPSTKNTLALAFCTDHEAVFTFEPDGATIDCIILRFSLLVFCPSLRSNEKEKTQSFSELL
jgi:hypothetical protein